MEKKELPEGWEWTKLRDISDRIHYGYTASAENKKVGPKLLRITDIQDNKVDWPTVPYCPISEKDLPNYLLKSGDLVFARTGATVGKSFLLEGDIPESVFASYLIRVILKKTVDPKFIYCFFQSPHYWSQIEKQKVGAGQENVNSQKLSQIEIPLPPLPLQRQIVAVLEQAETLKRQRQDADALTGALLQSVFYEMFGDPVRNEKGWGTKSFEDCMSSIIDYRGKTPTKTKSGIPLVTAKIVKDGKILPPDEFISPNDYESWMRRGIPKKGDVILTTEGPLGTVAQLHTDEKLAFAQRLIILRGKSEVIDNVYLAHFFRSDYFQNQLRSKATGSTVEGISQGNLRETFIRIPPLALQQQFARIVEEVERVREKQVESGKEIEALCGVLMQRAFAGELPTGNA